MNFQIFFFVGNTGSAIVARSAHIHVLEGTLATFMNNTALDGGAMALLGLSILELFRNSQLVFKSNHASRFGGALYATSPHQTEFIFSHKCFISYNNSFSPPDTWDTSLIFINNSAKYGYDIYTDSLLPCAKNALDFETNVSLALKWESFMYSQVGEYTIATSPANISFTLPPEIAPGERVYMHQMSKDDLNQLIPSVYQVTLEISKGTAKTDLYITDDDYIRITGKQDTEFNLTLQTQSTRHVSLTKTGRLGKCPLGFTFQQDECICSTAYLTGIHECDREAFQAMLSFGYWVGCTGTGGILTGYCPLEYCSYKHHSPHGKDILVPKTCEELQICNNYRTGQLCGECEKDYAVYFHSDNYKCGKCEYGAVGILIYVVADLLPLVAVFVVVVFLNVKMTSGMMQSFLTFAQTITLINRTPSFVHLPQIAHTFIRIHTFIFGFLSLDFFKLDELSFCLWRGATVLHNLCFHYMTTLFTIFLLGSLILIVKHSPNDIKGFYWQKIVQKLKYSKTPIIHSITTFLILSYTQYTVVSFLILSRLTLYGEEEKEHGSFVRLQGTVEYFGPHHLPYAIPAVLVLLFLTLPPPLLLISYPLLWKIKAKCRFAVEDNSDTTPWLIRKLLPLIDGFQGVFKDNCRLFAGLLLLWRVIIAAIYAFSDSMDTFYFLTIGAVFSFFAIHAVMRPYKRRLYNIIDVLMLGNMFVISYLSWFIYHFTLSHHGPTLDEGLQAIIAVKIVLMYLPLLLLVFVIFRFCQRYKVISGLMQFLNSEEEIPSTTVTDTREHSQYEKESTVADDHLFARASEINTPPQTFILSTTHTGFELQSTETGQDNVVSKGSEES